MAAYASAYKAFLQGVSQQLPSERLSGQATAQHNMLSDPVTGVRRRLGVQFRKQFQWTGINKDNLQAWFTDVGGSPIHILVNTAAGTIKILNASLVEEATLGPVTYLQATDRRSIRGASVGQEFFLCNTEKNPSVSTAAVGLNPDRTGYYYVVAGAFSRGYNVTITYGGTTFTVTYTTPNGSSPGDAAVSTPEYIAQQLANGIVSTAPSLTLQVNGPYVYVANPSGTLRVNTSVGTQYMQVSKMSSARSVGDLPARLPPAADGYNVRVGVGGTYQYYRYNASTTEWVEVGSYAGPSGITNAPISIYWNGSAWALNTTAFNGRPSGDDDSNPKHEWMTYGISGMGTYQGRLVILSGPMVSMSASNKPRDFFRTTVTSVVSSDPIEVGSSTNSSAAYEWCIPFQKDLVVFSNSYQAVVPSGNAAVTPSTAVVVPTSSFSADTTCSPISIGRTLLYAKPRSDNFFGILEMLPSSYTDSQYTSTDTTPHLPRYMPGRCRHAAASSVANIAAFVPTGDDTSAIIHEYHWDADNKVQQAWHTWSFPYPVAALYFSQDVMSICFAQNDYLVIGSIDVRAGNVAVDGTRRPFLDIYGNISIVAGVGTIPSWMLSFDPDIGDKLGLIQATGNLAGEAIGFEVSGSTITTVPSFQDGTAVLGLPYMSSIAIPGPIDRDYNGNPIYTGKVTLQRIIIGTRGSSEFDISVTDDRSGMDEGTVPTLYMSSKELELGRGLYGGEASSVVPCRTDARTTVVEMSTDKTGEINITSIEYIARAHHPIRRR